MFGAGSAVAACQACWLSSAHPPASEPGDWATEHDGFPGASLVDGPSEVVQRGRFALLRVLTHVRVILLWHLALCHDI